MNFGRFPCLIGRPALAALTLFSSLAAINSAHAIATASASTTITNLTLTFSEGSGGSLLGPQGPATFAYAQFASEVPVLNRNIGTRGVVLDTLQASTSGDDFVPQNTFNFSFSDALTNEARSDALVTSSGVANTIAEAGVDRRFATGTAAYLETWGFRLLAPGTISLTFTGSFAYLAKAQFEGDVATASVMNGVEIARAFTQIPPDLRFGLASPIDSFFPSQANAGCTVEGFGSFTQEQCSGSDQFSLSYTSPLLPANTNYILQFSSTAVVAAIPEPETYALMIAGLGVLGFVNRRRGQKAQARGALRATP